MCSVTCPLRFAEEGGDILAPVALNFTAFLERYLSADSSRAMKVLTEVDLALQQLASAYPWMRILDDLFNASRCNAGVSWRPYDEDDGGKDVKTDAVSKPAAKVNGSELAVWSSRPDVGTRLDRFDSFTRTGSQFLTSIFTTFRGLGKRH